MPLKSIIVGHIVSFIYVQNIFEIIFKNKIKIINSMLPFVHEKTQNAYVIPHTYLVSKHNYKIYKIMAKDQSSHKNISEVLQ